MMKMISQAHHDKSAPVLMYLGGLKLLEGQRAELDKQIEEMKKMLYEASDELKKTPHHQGFYSLRGRKK